MTRAKWVLLYRRENGYLVHIYEPMRPGMVKRLKKEGWRQV